MNLPKKFTLTEKQVDEKRKIKCRVGLEEPDDGQHLVSLVLTVEL